MTDESRDSVETEHDDITEFADTADIDINVDTKDPEQLRIAGLTLIARGEFEDAKTVYQNLTKLLPKDHEAWKRLRKEIGVMDHDLKNQAEARD